jgi:hypothetical protein
MNNTRIRYVNNPDGTSESMQVFKGDKGGEYRALITQDGKDGYILSMPNREICLKLNGTSSHKTKIKLKAALKTFGVVFLNEKRDISEETNG